MESILRKPSEANGLAPMTLHVNLVAAVAGLASHQIFRKSEPTVTSFILVLVALQWTTALFYGAKASEFEHPILCSLRQTTIFTVTYLAVLSTSIVLYRAFFHPLRKYPGPFLPKVTKWIWFFRYRTGRYHRWVYEMHLKVRRMMILYRVGGALIFYSTAMS